MMVDYKQKRNYNTWELEEEQTTWQQFKWWLIEVVKVGSAFASIYAIIILFLSFA